MAETGSKVKSLGLLEVIAIGIGGMVGGGIFAVLGLAASSAHGGTPVAFMLAGIVALLTSYSYAKLSTAYPSRGGTVEFLGQAFGTGLFTGGMNVLLLLSYVVMLSLYSYAFGSYGATFLAKNMQVIGKHLLISGVIVFFTLLNIIGAKAVGKAEKWIVLLKLSILIFFIFVGFKSINTAYLSPATWTSPAKLIAGGMIIFLAYEGFELIANTAEDIKNPNKNLPLAYYISIIFVILLYVMVSLVAVGNLPIAKLVVAKDYALAEAAKPFLGQAGFILIAFAALLSTSSAVNATLYGSTRISYIIAKEGELPRFLEDKIWNRPIEGLLITSLLTLLIANLFDLSSISLMGSAGFLIVFAMVNTANFKLHKKTKSNKWISLLGMLTCFSALTLLVRAEVINPLKITFLVGMIVVSFAVESIYRALTGREIKIKYRSIRHPVS